MAEKNQIRFYTTRVMWKGKQRVRCEQDVRLPLPTLVLLVLVTVESRLESSKDVYQFSSHFCLNLPFNLTKESLRNACLPIPLSIKSQGATLVCGDRSMIVLMHRN